MEKEEKEKSIIAPPKISAESKPQGTSGLKSSKVLIISLATLIVIAGIVTGWFLYTKVNGQASSGIETKTNEKIIGTDDEKTFPQSATGVLEEGGIDGEGTHHLVREGGPSQNAYLTSTVIDLQSFVGKKVQVWGQTFSARKAGWLMDVGKVKILD